MARHRQHREQVEIWPGFVDALSTLLLSIIFLLIVFVLGQFFLGQLLLGRNETVQRLQGEVRDLAGRLGIEQDAAAELRRTLARLNADLRQAFLARDDLEGELGRADAERDRLGERVATLTDEQARLQRALDAARGETEAGRAQGAELARLLAEAQRVATADKAAIELQLGQLVQLRQDIAALERVRGELEGRVAALAEAQGRSEAERAALAAELGGARDRASALEARLAEAAERTVLAQRELERRDLRLAELERTAQALGTEGAAAASGRDEALAQVRTLTDQIATLSRQLLALDQALGLKQREIDSQSTAIADLGQRLNVALASRVEELSQYRSEFFGRLRQSLGTREDVRIVGDRFVFQSEVLFESGSAVVSPAGQARLAQLATTLREITADIPDELPWVIQVDGHTDRRPINTARFPSNWELSSSRAIAVARFLSSQGLAPERVAARGFAEFQPLDPAEGEEAYRRNRRIEIKLTTR